MKIPSCIKKHKFRKIELLFSVSSEENLSNKMICDRGGSRSYHCERQNYSRTIQILINNRGLVRWRGIQTWKPNSHHYLWKHFWKFPFGHKFLSSEIPDKKQAAIEEDESCLGQHWEELSAIITSPGAPRDEGCHRDHPGITQQEESSVTFSLLLCSIKTKMKLLNKNSVKPKSLI